MPPSLAVAVRLVTGWEAEPPAPPFPPVTPAPPGVPSVPGVAETVLVAAS
ncbi:hypothetical protein MPS_2669 [Mycobacterium pseudoshottsii JCM 15466]|nr:hypothetical protein MPS_2669 [Mycobacterium pseudoshottsii JCM 15466]